MRYVRVVLGFAAFFAVFFSPALFGGNQMTTAGDGSTIALPAYAAHHGFWEPDIMLGYPWASNFNGGWSPLFLLHFIPHSFNAYMLAAYVIAAVGAFGCVDALTRSTLGGIVAGLSYALGGFMIGHFGHYDIVQAAAWTPCVFWALFVQREQTTLRIVALGAAAVAMCALGGQPQVLAYTLLFAVAFIIVTAFGRRERARYLAGGAATIVLGLALAMVALAPGLVLALASFRAQASLDYFLAFSEPLWQIPVRLFFPYVAGVSTQPLYPFSATGSGSEPELAAYAGIMTIALAFIALVARRRDATVLFLGGATLAGLVLSTGDALHIAAITFHIPVLNLFRAQGRNMLEVTLFIAILGGVGVAELVRGRVKPATMYGAIGAVAVLMLVAIAAALGSGVLSADAARPLQNPAFLIPIAIFALSSAALVTLARMPSSRLVHGALALCAVVDLASFAGFEYWRTPLNEQALTPPPLAATLHEELKATHQRIFSVAGAAVNAGIPPNLSLMWGVPAAGGYVSLLLTSPGIFLQLFPQGTVAPELLLNRTDRSFDLASIRYIVAPAGQTAALLAAHPAWHLRQSTPLGDVLENDAAEPRVRALHRVVSLAPDATLQAIRTGSLDLHRTAIVQGAETLDTAPDPADAATITALSADEMHVGVSCGTACFLQTSDTYNGMWNANVDGHRVPLRLVDYALRGVFVPAGKHTVVFAYRPWIIGLGAAVSVIALCVVLLMLVLSARWGELRREERFER